MASLDELHTALINADKAGDTEAATTLATEIKHMQGGSGIGTGEDIAKSAAPMAAKGVIDFLGSPEDLSEMGARGLDRATRYIGGKLGYDIAPRPDMTPAFGAENIQKGVESKTGPFYEPQTPIGKVVGGGIRAVANPTNYIGPGSAALKIGGAALSGAGSEAAGQAAEGTPYETPARIGGAVLGGMGAVAALGPRAPMAKVPTAPELQTSSDLRYGNVRQSDVLGNPDLMAPRGLQLEQQLTNSDKYKFTPGQAPETLALVEQLKSTPPRGDIANPTGVRAVADELGLGNYQSYADSMRGVRTVPPAPSQNLVTPANLDTLRQQFGDIAAKTEPTGPGGRLKPTPDAKAAMVAKRNIEDLLENPPPGFILSGDVAKLRNDAAAARGDYKSLSQLRDIDYRTNKAEVKNEQNLTGSLGQKLQTNIGNMLVNPKQLRGYSDESKALIGDINKGATGATRQVGRLANYDQWNTLALLGSGGAYAPYQIAASLLGHGARHLADKSVVDKVARLTEQIGKESPEYARRVAALPKTRDTAAGKAAIIRALLNSQR